MWQAHIVVHLIQRELLTQAVLALAQGRDSPSHRRHMLAQAEIDPVTVGRRITPPTDCHRINLTTRQHVAAVGRRVITLCKGDEGLCHQLALYHTYYNFCLPHTSLRLPLPQPEATHGTAKRWQPRTPAMAAGLTDHV